MDRPEGSDVLSTRTPLSRRTVRTICDDVPMPPFLELFAGQHARENIVNGIREQLVTVREEFDQSPKNVHDLGSAMVRQEYASHLQDGERYGLRSAEALTVGPGAALQKLFSSVEQKGGSVIDMVAQLDTVMRTVHNRSDQLITAHFDRDWFPSSSGATGSNPGLHAIKSLEAVFVSTKIADLLLKTPANKKGYVIGVLDSFPQDAVPPDVLTERQDIKDKDYATPVEVKPWDIIGTWTPAAKYIANSLQMMRIFLDPNLMYARRVTMERVVSTLMKTSRGNFYAISSSILDGIVDIFPGALGSSAFPQQRAERVLLGNTIIMSLDAEYMDVSGVPGVLSFDVVKVDLMKQISFRPANAHLVAQLGRDLLAPHAAWEDFEDKAVLLSPDDFRKSDIFLGVIGDEICVVPQEAILDARVPSLEDVTRLLIQKFAGSGGLRDLWCGTLDQLSISAHCTSVDLLGEMLQYCGLEVVGHSRHNTLMTRIPGVGVTDGIYIRSASDPEDVVRWHSDPSNYKVADIQRMSLSAQALVRSRAQDAGKTVQDFLNTSAGLLDLDRYFSYYYAKMKCRKKDSTSKGGNIPNHVVSHPYWAVMAYPFVDTDKTTCGDWNTMTYSLGVMGARNNYLVELQHLYSGQSLDKRHLELFADYVFMNMFPAGIGFHGSKKSGMGSVSLMSIEQSESLLLTEMFNKPVESSSNLAVSVLFGLGAEGVAIAGEGSRERAVRMFSQMRREYAYRVRKRYERLGAKKAIVNQGNNSEASYAEMLARFRLMETDPYQSILTFKVKPAVVPDHPANMLPAINPVKKGSFGMMARIKAGVDITMALLDRLTPLMVERNKTVTIKGDMIPIVALYRYMKGVSFYGGTFS